MGQLRGDCAFNGLGEIACVRADIGEDSISVDLFGLTPNELYYIRVSDWSATAAPNSGQFTLCVDKIPPILTINQGGSPLCMGTLYDTGGASGVSASDHGPQAMGPADDGHGPIHEAILDLCRGADVLIHDAQFTATELPLAEDYGHATVDYCYRLAEAAEVGGLVLFHHSPMRVDEDVERLCDLAPPGLAVTMVRQGQTIPL